MVTIYLCVLVCLVGNQFWSAPDAYTIVGNLDKVALSCTADLQLQCFIFYALIPLTEGVRRS